jgi:hypothetical protein
VKLLVQRMCPSTRVQFFFTIPGTISCTIGHAKHQLQSSACMVGKNLASVDMCNFVYDFVCDPAYHFLHKVSVDLNNLLIP